MGPSDPALLVKGLQVALAMTALAILVVYIPMVACLVWKKPTAVATQWLVALVTMWSAQFLTFGRLVWSYAAEPLLPRTVAGLPDSWRVLSLTLVLTVGTFLLAARSGMLWPRFFTWGGIMAGVVGWVMLG